MSTSFIDKFRRLALAASVYFVWKPINLVLFQSGNVSVVAMVGQKIETIQYIGASWRNVPKTAELVADC